MAEFRELTIPFSDETIKSLKCGEICYITGPIYTARDAAHQRMADMLAAGEEMPFDFEGNVVFYAGPSPTKPGMVIGSIGPTTAGRMDSFAPDLIAKGLKVMIAKGSRNDAVKKSVVEHGGVYFAGIGGIAALMSECVKSVELVDFEDLGPEAIRRLEVEKLPVVVALDSDGNDVYDRKR
ncbi:MAG: FumA C-terminus/TtdB family hydratase beta subunit [Oscillospiraceae bacterium]|nr:FumA C-terminus/TtdB family hydratase beta subunit [Oscillospiraceae bacterium]